MKINKANNNGSASIIIPKEILKDLEWRVGDDCKMVTEDKKLIIEKLVKKEYI